MSEQGGRLRRAVRRIAAADEALEAEDLRQQVAAQGGTTVADCAERDWVTVVGTVRSLTLRPRDGAPALEVELYDGTAVVTLVWLGQRDLAGVSAGRQLRATGRITSSGGRRIIFNPRYELVLPEE